MLTDIYKLVKGLFEDHQFLRKHRNMLHGTPILEFDEVCSMLRLSERSVRRLRESGKLVGFTYGRRRFYSQHEVDTFIAQIARGNYEEETINLNTDDGDKE